MTDVKDTKWFALAGFWLPAVLLMAAGCGPGGGETGLSALRSRDVQVRILAIKHAGDNKVTEAVPPLVDCLEDEDKSVRFYSIEALRRITGTDQGYDYKAAAHVRAEAVKRWCRFIESNESGTDSVEKDKDGR